MIRPIAMCVALAASAAAAQVPTVYLLQSAAEPSDSERKWACEALLGLDPRSVASFEGIFLKARLSAAHNSVVVIDALQAVGLTYVLVTAPPTTSAEQDGFPVFVHSGDNEADEERYKTAKEAWIAAHPAVYHALIDPVGSTNSQPPGTKEP